MSPVASFSVPMRKVMDEQPEPDIVLPNLKISRKLEMFHLIEYFLDKSCLEMLSEVILYTLDTQIIATEKKKRKRAKGQEITSEELF